MVEVILFGVRYVIHFDREVDWFTVVLPVMAELNEFLPYFGYYSRRDTGWAKIKMDDRYYLTDEVWEVSKADAPELYAKVDNFRCKWWKRVMDGSNIYDSVEEAEKCPNNIEFQTMRDEVRNMFETYANETWKLPDIKAKALVQICKRAEAMGASIRKSGWEFVVETR